MELKNGKITIMTNKDGCDIHIDDGDASITMVKIHLTTEQFCQAIGRLAYTTCEKLEVFGLDKIGKKMDNKFLEFPFDKKCKWSERDELAYEEALRFCPEGWYPDKYFGSQNSFFIKDGQEYARVVIRRWV